MSTTSQLTSLASAFADAPITALATAALAAAAIAGLIRFIHRRDFRATFDRHVAADGTRYVEFHAAIQRVSGGVERRFVFAFYERRPPGP